LFFIIKWTLINNVHLVVFNLNMKNEININNGMFSSHVLHLSLTKKVILIDINMRNEAYYD